MLELNCDIYEIISKKLLKRDPNINSIFKIKRTKSSWRNEL